MKSFLRSNSMSVTRVRQLDEPTAIRRKIRSRGLVFCWFPVLFLYWVLCSNSPLIADDVMSTEQFNAYVKQQLLKEKPAGDAIRVEGRVQAHDRKMLKLRKCDVTFVGESLAELDRSAKSVELRGSLVREKKNKGLEFQVTSTHRTSTDGEVLENRRKSLFGKPAEEWHRLVEWGRKRADFYGDEDLRSRTTAIEHAAFELEREALPKGDSSACFALADRVDKAKGPGTLVQDLLHEGCLIEFEKLANENQLAPFDRFLKLAQERLPGASQVDNAPDEKLRERYFARPRETFRSTPAPKRPLLHRFLFADAQLRVFKLRVKPDYSNVVEIANAIERKIPEFRSAADALRDEALEWRGNDMEKLTRGQIVELESDYRKRGKATEGRAFIKRWMDLRRQRIDESDVDIDEAVDLANDYKLLLERADLGVELLLATWKRAPGAALLTEKLEAEGYRLHDGKWLTSKQFENRPESKFEVAVRAGRAEQGMNSEQIRRALGAPKSVVRFVTEGLVTEHWIYSRADGTRNVVKLARQGNRGDFLVVETGRAVGP